MPNNRWRRADRLRRQETGACNCKRCKLPWVEVDLSYLEYEHIHSENCNADNCEACRPFNYELTKSVDDANRALRSEIKRVFNKVKGVFK